MKYLYAKQLPKGDCGGIIQKAIRMIKAVAILLCVGMVSVHADTYSQQITVDIKNGNLSDLFEKIQQQSDYIFFYQDRLVSDKRVDVSARNENMHGLLRKVLSKEDLDYVITGNQVTIKPREEVQQRTVQGTVRDENGVPLQSVNVLIKSSTVGTMTDQEGRYQLAISGEVTLIFSMMGYQDIEENTQNRAQIDVVLTTHAQGLEEVVVTGYSTIE